MPTSLENVMMLGTVTQKSDQFTEETATPKAKVDLDIFGAKEIRDVLKSRSHCLRAGFSSKHIIIATLNEIREHYILKVGLPTYLSQMLGELGKAQVQYCTLFDQNDQPIKLDLHNNHTLPLQRYITKRFHWDNLPFKVEVRKERDSDRVEVRYL